MNAPSPKINTNAIGNAGFHAWRADRIDSQTAYESCEQRIECACIASVRQEID
jgi:hypothetical protein